MEQYGIYYYFEHTRDKHTLILADAKSSHSSIGTIPFLPLVDKDRREREHINQLTSERRLRTGRVAVNDYDFLQPNAKLLCEAQSSERYSRSNFEVYAYPGKYPRKNPESLKKRIDGDRFAKIRLQAEQAADHRRYTAGDAVSLFPGGLFTLEQHTSPSANGEHLVLRASHTLSTERYSSGTSESPAEFYYGQYELHRSDRPFRAPLVTPKPVIHGVQTAVVVGPPGEEIYTDKFGRIKVQFHWDRQGKRDTKSSCWIRVAQTVAGRKWGSFQLPRIGQEVVVAFLEGDPDRPLVTGCVYNAVQMPPNDLPNAKMVTGFKTNSTKGGSGSNSMFADDTKGKEKLSIHAQYDMLTEVEHDQSLTVDGTSTETIKKDTSITIMEGNYSHIVKTGTATINVKGKVAETFQDVQETRVTKSITIVSGTSNILIEAATDITLHVGASKLAMHSDGRIELSGKSVAITGSDAVNVSGMSIKEEATNDHSISGAIVKSSGSVSNTVHGAMVMLNP